MGRGAIVGTAVLLLALILLPWLVNPYVLQVSNT